MTDLQSELDAAKHDIEKLYQVISDLTDENELLRIEVAIWSEGKAAFLDPEYFGEKAFKQSLLPKD